MSSSYALGQLARALTTASTHEDEETRRRADQRAGSWLRVLSGMAVGGLKVGSRTPAGGLPAWVTLEVLRGGFATGSLSAGGPLTAHDNERAKRLGIPHTREAVFGSWLTDAGLAELTAKLEEGAYEIVYPEHAALLVVAWLAGRGDRDAALGLLDVIGPFSNRIGFAAPAGEVGGRSPGQVWRRTAEDARMSLATRRTPKSIVAEREAVSVWLPLTDRLLALWCSTGTDEASVRAAWSLAAAATAAGLVADYEAALLQHRHCRKYRDQKENLPILISLTQDRLAGPLTVGKVRRVRHITAAMLSKRGHPAGKVLADLRGRQARSTAQPLHADLAQIAARRCAGLPAGRGISDVHAILQPVTADEARSDVPAGTPLPASAVRAVRLAGSGTAAELVGAGVIPSSEVLAELVPLLTSEQVGASYSDPTLARLMAATYEAFRRRRSLLLLDLASQVRFSELPWVQALQRYTDTGQPDNPLSVARTVAALAIDSFPGTILPNPLIAELKTLFGAAGLPLPLTEELAADIFMGRFADKFRLAAQVAAGQLTGSLYARYYDINYTQVAALPSPPVTHSRLSRKVRIEAVLPTLADLCSRPVGADVSWIVQNAAIIEQQQVITTHNLAVLHARGGVTPKSSWFDLAVAAGRHCAHLLERAPRRSRPWLTVKDAAYAWRQALYFLTLAGEHQARNLVEAVAATPAGTKPRMRLVLAGLTDIADGGHFNNHGASTHGQRLLGWTLELPVVNA